MVSIPAGTEVATVSETDDPIVLATEPFDAVAPQLLTVQTAGLGGELLSLDEDLRRGPIPVFPSLTPGAALYLGFDRSLTGTVLDLGLALRTRGSVSTRLGRPFGGRSTRPNPGSTRT